MKERKGVLINKEDWELENVEETPQQQNGSDCGMFSCKVAEYLSRDAELTFTQENMNYYRERMIYEIFRPEILFP
jgi:sentrin-specific protease 1